MAVTGITNGINTYGSYTEACTSRKQKKDSTAEKPKEKNEGTNGAEEYIKNDNVLKQSEYDTVEFKSITELMLYLSKNYETVRTGIAEISVGYLRECMTDESKLNKLYNMLEEADTAVKASQENIEGCKEMKVSIDKDGNMSYEASSGSVVFNEAKRARQLAAAKTPAEVRVVLSLLNQDLSDCKNGVLNNMCDNSEVSKVQAMLQKAYQRIGRVSNNESDENEEGMDSFYLNMLM